MTDSDSDLSRMSELMTGTPPYQFTCRQCGAPVGPSAVAVAHHYQIAHGWAMTPGRVLPVGMTRVRFRRARRWLRRFIGLVG